MRDTEIPRRRVVLGTAALGAGALPSIVGAAETPDEEQKEHRIIENAYRIRRRTGSKELFEQYLLNHGFEKGFERTVTRELRPSDGSDGIDKQKIEKSDLELTAALYLGRYNNTADGDWETNGTPDGIDDTDDGGGPDDIVSVQWEHTDWDIVWDSWWSDNRSSKRKATERGVAFGHDDYVGGDGDFSNDKPEGYAGVEVKERGEESPAIFVNYYHTWLSGSVDGITIGFDGSLGISVSLTAKRWDNPLQAYDEY